MCYHYSQAYKLKKIAEKYKARVDKKEDWFPEYHINGFSSPKTPVVTQNQEISLMQWGLIPSWTKSVEAAEEIKWKTLNAKAETLTEKPAFQSVRQSRCLVPISGFFEWQTTPTGKQPFYIYGREEEILSLAGVQDNWMNPETGQSVQSFSIVTTRANDRMAEIHNSKQRMPLILTPDKSHQWLSDQVFEQWNSVIEPVDSDYLAAHPISGLINRKGVSHNTPEVIRKIIIPQQQKLF